MKIQSICLLTSLLVLITGCKTGEPKATTSSANAPIAAYAPAPPKFVAMDSRAQYSVEYTSLLEGRTDDGRLQIGANIKNRENRRIEVQVQCQFNDPQGFALDETPWQTLILTENGQETVRFTAMSPKATDYTVRVRSAR